MSINRSYIATVSLLSLTIFSGVILSSSYVSADDSVVDQINITVPVSCSLSGTGQNSHNAEIVNGTYEANIGTTTLKAYCNDNEGFAIYAAGYTGNEIGGTNSTKLVGTAASSNATIVTGTATSAGNPDVSNWAMKLATISSPTPTYPITIDSDTNGSFSSYHIVPTEYAKVAHRDSSTDTGTNAEGATLTTTYAAYISKTQAADTYSGQVIYTLVHPSSVDSTAMQNSVTVIFEGNGLTFPNGQSTNTVRYTNVCDPEDSNDCSIISISGTYSNPTEPFNRWFTTVNDWEQEVSKRYYDYNTDDYINYDNLEDSVKHFIQDYYNQLAGTTFTFYAPVTFDAVYSSANKSKLNNYYKIQDLTASMCSEVTNAEDSIVIDARDNNTYKIGKIYDGNCWLLDNLRLDPTNNTTASNMSQSNTNASSDAIYNYLNGGNSNNNAGWTSTAVSSPSNWPNDTNDSSISPFVHISNDNSYGAYYNFCAATVGTYCYNSSSGTTNSSSDICPVNWRLPTDSEMNYFQNAYYPATRMNFVYAGYYGSYYQPDSIIDVSSNGFYWTSSLSNSSRMLVWRASSNSFTRMSGSYLYAGGRFNGNSIRCVLNTSN